ncbi:aldo/keto reductase [Neorhizobium sp. P12A]|uniref:aldo/keto reductase n=1 Tax=Neorhizobium sp. P12A TaxID=2268027 RepID=UPI0011ECC6CE|nr:aldo/keto reductase [Neorhizobium sp. P12A]KAA0688112.1 aldo/keto reductase [Neorhizobium sp. P12A]
MIQKRLGRSGLTVSPVCLGAMMFGDQTDAAEADRIVGYSRDPGVNFIDTADSYADGRSEEIVGKAISADRSRWILATKVGGARNPDVPNGDGLGRRWMVHAAESSLKRLGTDWIDLYYLHRDDQRVPLEETVRTMGELITQGKVRYWGFSNYSAWRIIEMIHICDTLGIPRPIAAQPLYNAMTRVAEVEYLPACAKFSIGVVSYSPLARGVLTGKYRVEQAPDPTSRAGRNDTRLMQTEFRPESLAIAERIQAHAVSQGRSAIGFALNWALGNPTVTAVIAGPRTLEQWTTYLEAAAEGTGDGDDALVDALVPPGHASTPGYTDPLYPVTGRTGVVPA